MIFNFIACHYSCQECIGSERSDCISDKCAGNHVYSNGMCSCPYWAYDLEKNKNCSSKLFFLRKQPNFIMLKSFYFSDKTSLVCHATCNESQCFGPNFDDCYSCIEGRTMKSNACFCNDGTYEDSLGSCKSLILLKILEILNHFFLECYPTCKKCNGPLFSNCLEECVSNSRGIAGIPIEGICNCSPDLIETLENDCPSMLTNYCFLIKL